MRIEAPEEDPSIVSLSIVDVTMSPNNGDDVQV